MIVFGGKGSVLRKKYPFILDLENLSVEKLPEPYERIYHTACLISDQIYLFGG